MAGNKKNYFVKKGLAGSQQVHASMLNNVDLKSAILKDYHLNVIDRQDREQRVLSKQEKKKLFKQVKNSHKAYARQI